MKAVCISWAELLLLHSSLIFKLLSCLPCSNFVKIRLGWERTTDTTSPKAEDGLPLTYTMGLFTMVPSWFFVLPVRFIVWQQRLKPELLSASPMFMWKVSWNCASSLIKYESVVWLGFSKGKKCNFGLQIMGEGSTDDEGTGN